MNAVSAEEDNIFTVNVYDKNGNVIDTYTKKDSYPSIKAIEGYEGVYYAKMEGQDYMDDYLDFPFFDGMGGGNPEELGFVRNDELLSKFPTFLDGHKSYMRRQAIVDKKYRYFGNYTGYLSDKDYEQAKKYSIRAKDKYLHKKSSDGAKHSI